MTALRHSLTCIRCSSGSTPAPPNSPRPRPICIRPMRRPSPARRPDESRPSDRDKIVILGGGPNRIGQGIEFDYCCCHACFALREAGFETIMVNCNPETVSTDYDTSDRLYFEPLTPEDVLEILAKEQENGRLKGVIVQFGGQTPLKLADALQKAAIPILGTSVDFDRSRRGSRPLQAPARQDRPQTADERHRLFGRAIAHRRGRTRPAARRAPVLCAGRPRDGDHPRQWRVRRLSARHPARPRAVRRQGALSERQDRPDQYGARQEPAFVRPLSVGRDRGRCRCAFGRRRRLHLRHHGAYRGGRHSFRRQRLLAAAALALAGKDRRARTADPRTRPGARRRRPDECAICAEGR